MCELWVLRTLPLNENKVLSGRAKAPTCTDDVALRGPLCKGAIRIVLPHTLRYLLTFNHSAFDSTGALLHRTALLRASGVQWLTWCLARGL